MHCVKTITEALSEVPDVTDVREVSLEKGMARVEGSPDPPTPGGGGGGARLSGRGARLMAAGSAAGQE